MKAVILSLILLLSANLYADKPLENKQKLTQKSALTQEKKKMKEVVIYSTVMCPYCVRAKDLLKQKNVEYTEHFIERDSAKLAEMKSRTNNARTVPQIFVGDTHVGGYDQLVKMNDSGELDKLLRS